MIILNEKEYAEYCLRNNIIYDKPFRTLSIIAKYYYHICGYRKKKITELLTNFISKTYPRYTNNKASWEESIDKIAKNAGKYKLYEISGVWITKAELETIEGINNKVLERLAFTLLCLAKLGNIKNPNNTGWVNITDREIFKMARISCGILERQEKIGDLFYLKLIDLPVRPDNLSMKVLYINDESEKMLFISDFRELGYEYLNYKGGNFTRCQECGKLIRNNKYGNKKYCSDCVAYSPQNIKKIICEDCGIEFEVSGNNKRTTRCKDCQNEKNNELAKIRMQKYRAKNEAN